MTTSLIKFTKVELQIINLIKEHAESFSPPVVARLAGGLIRDKIMDIVSHDIDVAVDRMSGYEFASGLISKYNERVPDNKKYLHKIARNPEKSKHLETTVINLYGIDVDFTNLRSEKYTDTRIPIIVPGTPLEDALRRDCTINALFYNINTGEIEDFTGKGLDDIQNRIIRTPIDPYTTFMDDPLRILRIFRFRGKFGFEIEKEIYSALEHVEVKEGLMKKVSRERIWNEINKMLTYDYGYLGMLEIIRTGYEDCIFPTGDKSSENGINLVSKHFYLFFLRIINVVFKSYAKDELKSKGINTDEITDEMTEEITEEMTEEITEEMTDEMTDEITEEITDEIKTEEITEEMTEEILKNTTSENYLALDHGKNKKSVNSDSTNCEKSNSAKCICEKFNLKGNYSNEESYTNDCYLKYNISNNFDTYSKYVFEYVDSFEKITEEMSFLKDTIIENLGNKYCRDLWENIHTDALLFYMLLHKTSGKKVLDKQKFIYINYVNIKKNLKVPNEFSEMILKIENNIEFIAKELFKSDIIDVVLFCKEYLFDSLIISSIRFKNLIYLDYIKTLIKSGIYESYKVTPIVKGNDILKFKKCIRKYALDLSLKHQIKHPNATKDEILKKISVIFR